METEAFPNTRQDVAKLKDTAVTAAKDLRETASEHLGKAKVHVSELKSTAVDAAKDLKSTAAVHVEKAKGQLRELASHAREEGGEHLSEVRGRFENLTQAARDYVSARPLACVGVAVAAGFLLGLTRRR